jgi:hypothetical protein
VDRIGHPGGEYLAVMENGIPATFEQRSLPIGALDKPYHQYTFVDDAADLINRDGVTIEVSRVAPAFGRDGGAIQMRLYETDDTGKPSVLSVKELLRRGYLT